MYVSEIKLEVCDCHTEMKPLSRTLTKKVTQRITMPMTRPKIISLYRGVSKDKAGESRPPFLLSDDRSRIALIVARSKNKRVAPSGTLAERKTAHLSLRGCDREAA